MNQDKSIKNQEPREKIQEKRMRVKASLIIIGSFIIGVTKSLTLIRL